MSDIKMRIKTQVLNKLTSSKNERKAFSLIWDMTKNGRGFKVIRQSHFKSVGLKDRNRTNEAMLRLIKKGLILRDEVDCYWYGGEGRTFGYAVMNWGCVRFLKFVEQPCFKCLKKVGL